MNKIINVLRKSELYFVTVLVLLNLYFAFALRGDNFINPTHLMMAVIMLMFANDTILEKLEKK